MLQEDENMNCTDIMKIPEFQEVMVLKAGKEGLERQVRWIYFADCLQCIQKEYKMENYIHGGEFVVLTNRNITDDDEKVIALVKEMAGYQIVALGINEGQISKALVNYCDSISLPLFELSEEYPLIDLSQILCQRLVMEENARNAAEQLFTSILDGEHLNKENIFAQARFLNIDLTGPFRVVEFFYENKENTQSLTYDENLNAQIKRKNEHAQKEKDPLTLGKTIKHIVQERFGSILNEEILIRLQAGLILALVPSNRITEEKLKEILISIYDRIRIECDLEVVIGVGNNVSYLEDIRTSRNEASSAVSAARMENRKESFYFFKDQGLYSFISRVEDNKFLDDFVEEHLGRLVRDDEVKNGKLCETLETYLNKNCSIKDTAEALFLHRNTLNYRLGRIREILDIDLGDLENCLNLKLAFLIRHYRAMYTMNK